ncbi:DUF7344 domain-containing protein [Natronosalvus halobius]|uniref:DUF7344 domain-containing protein n=1 Tax=Natronosalvus halobius TaxID=2953746 RepID=UPI00209F2C86|nr:hypothetical protein [Natronosalvus halobius]USZ73436.1 hypothetical protein NGM15_16295 [Natronosalvus halobius]
MTDGTLTQAELFDVFSNARRRQTVQYLKRHHGACDLAPLVEQVAAWENDTTTDDVTRAQRRRVYISLYQTHLPMLEDHGIVDWDPDAHRIELLPNEETFEPYLDRDLENQRPWHWYYASVSVVGAAVAVLAGLSVGTLTPGLLPFVALGLCVLVLVLAITHRASSRSKFSLPFATRRF